MPFTDGPAYGAAVFLSTYSNYICCSHAQQAE